MNRVLAILFCFSLASCAGKKAVGPDLVINPACLTKPIVLEGCDTTADPPHCKGSKITYRKGCEAWRAKPVGKP